MSNKQRLMINGLLLAGAFISGVGYLRANAGSAGAAAVCDPSDSAFVCGLHSPEDIVRLPSTHWVVASGLNIEWVDPIRVRGPEPLRAINIDTHEVRRLFPTASSSADWDRRRYPDCRAPPKWLMGVGVNARPLSVDKSRLYVASHGERESVEIIDVIVRGDELRTTWRGCVLVPKGLGIWPNAVVPLPDGGIALGGVNLAIWHRDQGWKKVTGFKGVEPDEIEAKDSGFANGVEVSRDGRWLLVADTARKTASRFSLDGSAPPTVIKFDFAPGYFWPDNLRWGEDGALYLSGPYALAPELPGPCYKRPICDELGTGIVRIDPETMTARVIYHAEGVKGKFGAATTALQIGDHFWIGTSVGDRVAIVSVPARDQ